MQKERGRNGILKKCYILVESNRIPSEENRNRLGIKKCNKHNKEILLKGYGQTMEAIT